VWKNGIAAVLLVIAGIAATASYAADRTSPPAAGEIAPDLRLTDQHGKVFLLGESLKQREFVVIAFYPKAFTSG